MKKTIGIIGPYSDTSGTGTFVRFLARGLAFDENYNVIVFSFNDPWQATEEDANIKIFEFGQLTAENIWQFGEFIAENSLAENVDLIAPQCKPELAVAGLVAKSRLAEKGKSVPLCGNWHSNFGWIKDAPYHLAHAKMGIVHMDSILPVSMNVQENITEILGSEMERRIVPSGGVDVEKIRAYETDRNVFKEQCDPNKFILFYVGRMLYNKGLDILAKALAILKDDDIHAVLVGKGPFLEPFSDAAKENDVAHQMTFTGFMPDETVYSMLRSADSFVLPSRWESFNISALEGMAAGLPVVATRVGGLPFWVGDSALLVEPESPEAFAAGIKKMKEDAAYRKEMAQKAYDLAPKYHWRNIAVETAKEYADLFGKEGSPAPDISGNELAIDLNGDQLTFQRDGFVTEKNTDGEKKYIITRYGLFHPSEALENEAEKVQDPEALYYQT